MLKILIKDLQRKKLMNIVLFLFIILSSTFLASSVNNLLVTNNALEYFEKKSNMADYSVITIYSEQNNKAMKQWISSVDGIDDYEETSFISVDSQMLSLGDGTPYNRKNNVNLSVQQEKYNFVFDEKDNKITLKSGEIALPRDEASRNNIEVGDTLIFETANVKKIFVVKHLVKDIIWGSPYMGIKRLIISNEDFEVIKKAGTYNELRVFDFKTKDYQKLEKDIIKHPEIQNVSRIDKSMVQNVYMMDMLISVILIIVSICLILISFVILRFTIVFTLQEDFKEIGIMKAIGIKNNSIKVLYQIKYLFISIIGAMIGVFISVPFGEYLLTDLRKNICMEGSSNSFFIHFLCGIVIVIIVSGFCFMCLGKLNRFSPIVAIRNGSNGESFKKTRAFALHKRRRQKPVFFLALNDVLSNLKRYMPMFITFIIGTIMIIIPLNLANTLKDESMVKLFGMDIADVYIDNNRQDAYIAEGSLDTMLNELEELEEVYKKEGIIVNIHPEYSFNVNVRVNKEDDPMSILAMQAKNYEAKHYLYTKGTPPLLENEVAITEISAKKLGISIGDVIQIELGKNERPYIVTALYQTLNMMGEGIRLSEKAETDFSYTSGIFAIQGFIENDGDIQTIIDKMQTITPTYKLSNATTSLKGSLGGVIDSVDNIKISVTLVVLIINFLITILMVKTFVTKDVGVIATLKSIGFSNKTTKLWQITRVLIILLTSIGIGLLLTIPLNGIAGKYTFGLMGAKKIDVVIRPLEVYFIYPLILLFGTFVAAFLSASNIKKVSIREMNGAE